MRPILYAVVTLAATFATPTFAKPLTGQSACNLVPLIAPAAHPLRKHPTLKRAVDALTAARDDKKKNHDALGRLDRALAPLWKEATRAFARPEADPKTGEPRPFVPTAARTFLTKWVLSPNAVLRIGDDRFEPALEVSAWMIQAACKAGDLERATAIGRGVSGPDGAPLRAFAALLLLERDTPDEAKELLATLGEGDFLEAWVRVELADTPEERTRWHELAKRRVQSPDQEVAWQTQKARL